MAVRNDDLKYQEVINLLKGLNEVKTPPHFEADLMRRINSEIYSEKESIWNRIFAPVRLIPSAALAVTTVIILFVLNMGYIESENPLSTDPRVREDVVAASDFSALKKAQISSKEESNTVAETPQQNYQSEANSLAGLSAVTPEENTIETGISVSENERNSGIYESRNNNQNIRTASYSDFNRAGLNFRQINLTPEERAKIIEMRNKLKDMITASARENR
jgi:hypothetical protein